MGYLVGRTKLDVDAVKVVSSIIYAGYRPARESPLDPLV